MVNIIDAAMQALPQIEHYTNTLKDVHDHTLIKTTSFELQLSTCQQNIYLNGANIAKELNWFFEKYW